jgi:DNA segregation ATPase FtsK/SpoIIIE-like protein
VKPGITTCQFCLSEMAKGQPFCRKCGTLFCPKCFNPLSKTSHLCPKCGFLIVPEQIKGAAQSVRPAGFTQPHTSILGAPPKRLPDKLQPSHLGHATKEERNCPQCGISINKPSDVCPSCGLLFESQYWLIEQGQKQRKPQPANPSYTPVAKGANIQRQSTIKPEPVKTETKFAAVEEKEPATQSLNSASPTIEETAEHQEKEAEIQTPSVTPAKTAKTPTFEEKGSVTQALTMIPLTKKEVPELKGKEPQTYQPPLTAAGWQLPPITLLDKPIEIALNPGDIEKRAQLIEEAIASYGVEAKIVQINVGPTVTQFGVEPGWDRKYKKIRERDQAGNINIRMEEVSKTRVKVDRISALASDLALALAAPSIRIEAPVPGKSIVGIEVPNATFGLVNLRGIIESPAFQKAYTKSKLALALGQGVGGETLAAELDKMPHLLIAGATGSGKSACLNSIICSLLIYNTPDDVRCIMIDPKRVELVNYNSLPHLVAPVVVDTDRAIMALRWLNQEMDNRYQKFAEVPVRNIETYNKKRQNGEAMPYIVLVIDELADLMMAASGEVEHTLCRLAQLARATGIHLIVATQRPSVDIVTGLIKANFPTRISFALTSQVDSRTILDSTGAEKLLGKGDMLYLPTDASKPKRLQGTFVSDAEIEGIVSFWADQRKLEVKPVIFEEMSKPVSTEKGGEDTLMEAARKLASEQKRISTSFLQRRLSIGYPRAARIMDKLTEEGYGRTVAE